jgi:hypothetical protein
MKLAATAAVISVLAGAVTASAQNQRSLTDSGSIWAPRTPPASSASRATSDGFGDGSVYERLVLARNSVKALTESLAAANSEAEAFKRQTADLTMKLQTLGISAGDEEEGKLSQKLLAAVRDLRQTMKENDSLRDQLVRLQEAVLVMLKTTENVAASERKAIETELRRTGELLGTAPGAVEAGAVEAGLSDGMVVDVREDLSLVVANIGERHQVKIGMPFQVWRAERRVGEVRVVDVREKICGAVIQNLESEENPIKAGDRLRVDARP